jgi:hypothetical protein
MTAKKDGRHYLAEIHEILTEAKPKLPDPAMQEKVEELQERGERVSKKLFLKTQGGTTLAEKARTQAGDLQQKLQDGSDDGEVKEAFDALSESLEFFVHRAETMIIRMT